MPNVGFVAPTNNPLSSMDRVASDMPATYLSRESQEPARGEKPMLRKRRLKRPFVMHDVLFRIHSAFVTDDHGVRRILAVLDSL
jgi:hypothetical protein